MDNQDAQRFGEILLTTLSARAGEKVQLTNAMKSWWWKALLPYQLKHIEQAFVIHSRRSHHKPAPSDIIDIINQQDGRPSADEAWPQALKAADESLSFVWTEEMAKAWYQCQPVFEQGDEIGARMAFRQTYQRLIDDARLRMKPVKWSVMLGHDPELRVQAVTQAEAKGYISHEQAQHQLPSPTERTEATDIVSGLLGYSGKKPKTENNFAKRFRESLESAQKMSAEKIEDKRQQEIKRKEQLEQRRQELIAQSESKQKEARA